MKLFGLITFLSVSLFLSLSTTQSSTVCGTTTCYDNQGKCFQDTTCICDDAYDTYPEDSNVMCNYEKKSQLIAFILETFISFGVGHFYLMNLKLAIPKLIFWLVGYFLFFAVRIISKKREENDSTTLLMSLGGCMTCTGMLCWQLFDIYKFAMNYYADGHGIDLKPWA